MRASLLAVLTLVIGPGFARAQEPELVAAADQHRQQEEGDQRILGDDDLGRAEVLDQLVAEVRVRRPQGRRDCDEDHRVAIDNPIHRPLFQPFRLSNASKVRVGVDPA